MERLGESGTKIRARRRVKDGKTRGVGDKDKGQEKSKSWKDLRRGGGGERKGKARRKVKDGRLEESGTERRARRRVKDE